MKNLKERGITLIALVITIIVLLILAGVTISLIWNGGIINKSQQAVDVQSEAQAREELSLALVEYKMKTLMEKDYNGELDTFLSTKPDTNSDEKWVARDAEEDNNYYEVEIGEWLFWVNKGTNEIISKGKKNPVPPIALSFKASSYDVNIGEDLNLLNELNITPSNANKNLLEWTISSSEKATITNGIVHGLEETTDAITVTVKSKEDASINASCTINVKAIELTGITLPAKITIGVGKTENLTVTYDKPNATYKELTWKVDDESTDIVKVENGEVTGVAVGKKTITATSTKYSGVSASCEVTVENILEISNIEQLYKFSQSVNNEGTDYSQYTVKLLQDIKVNEGIECIFDEDTGLLEVKEGNNKFYIGTGLKGKEGENTTFDTSASKLGTYYLSNTSTTETNPTESTLQLSDDVTIKTITCNNITLKVWEPIGNSTNKFNGNFDGNNKKIEGLFVVEPDVNNIGLFGYIISNSGIFNTIKNVTVENSQFIGNANVGGIIGTSSGQYILENLHSKNGFIISINFCGGIIGKANEVNVRQCSNNSLNVGQTVGGITGKLNALTKIEQCYNAGNIIGTTVYSRTGGIIGDAENLSMKIKYCYNLGNITVKNGFIGGISATLDSSSTIEYCYNSGNLFTTDEYTLSDGR